MKTHDSSPLTISMGLINGIDLQTPSPSILSPSVTAVLNQTGGYFAAENYTPENSRTSRASSIASQPRQTSPKYTMKEDISNNYRQERFLSDIMPLIPGYTNIIATCSPQDNSVIMYRAHEVATGRPVLIKYSRTGCLEDLTRIRHEWSLLYASAHKSSSTPTFLPVGQSNSNRLITGGNIYNVPRSGRSSAAGSPVAYAVDHENAPQQSSIADIPGALRPLKCLRLESESPRLAIVYPDLGNLQMLAERFSTECEDGPKSASRSCRHKRKDEIVKIISIMINVLTTLTQVHTKSITHNGLTSNSIFIDENDNTFISGWDFSFSLQAEDTSRGFRKTHLKQIADSMGYISPETTCLVNRLVDYRSDFYSIGCILYELLLGVLPFQSSDPAELGHLHVLRTAVAPSILAPWIPDALSQIIMKLLEKSADDRYSTANDIIHDLNMVLKCIETGEPIDEDFVPGYAAGACPIFGASQLIHGRESELSKLSSIYTDFESKIFQFMLVVGEPGSGKSRLIGELERSSIASHSFFSVTKYDEHLRGSPFYSIVLIIKNVVHQILSGSMTYIHEWRQNLISRLNVDLTVLYNEIPELEELMGKDYVNLIDHPAQPSGPVPREMRLKFVIKNLFCLFGSSGLTAVLDDVHWCSLQEIAFFRELAVFAREQFDRDLHVTFVCASADETCEQYHALIKLAKELNADHQEIRLAPLKLKDVRAMVQDIALSPIRTNGSRKTHNGRCTLEDLESSAFALQVDSLAKTIERVTNGNPLFAALFLRYLYFEQYIYYDNVGDSRFPNGRWKIDFEALNELQPPTTVQDTVIRIVRKLPRNTINVLRYAAGICNNSFTLADLAVAANITFADAVSALNFALQIQLVLPTSIHYKFPFQDPIGTTDINLSDEEIKSVAAASTYRFYHDAVQQAVYSLMDEQETWKVHRLISLRLINDGDDSVHRIVEIASQLNNAIPVIQSDEREMFLEYVLRAGKTVYARSDFDMADRFYRTALTLIPENVTGVSDKRLAKEIYLSLAELQLYRKKYHESLNMIDEFYKYCDTPLERASLLRIRAKALFSLDKGADAISTGLEALNMLGFQLEEGEDWNKDRADELKHKIPISVQEIRKLVNNKRSELEHHQIIQEIISVLTIPIISLERFELFKSLVYLSVSMFVEHGSTASCSISLLSAATLFQREGGNKNLALAYEYSKLAIVNLETDTEIGFNFGIDVYEFYALTMAIYFEPLSEVIRYYSVILSSGQALEEHGEVLALSHDLRPKAHFLSGEPLPEVLERFKKSRADCTESKGGGLWISIHRQVVLNLIGDSNVDNSSVWSNDADAMVKSHSAELRHAYWAAKVALAVICGEKAVAAEIMSNELLPLVERVIITVNHVLVVFYGSIALLDKEDRTAADNKVLDRMVRDLHDWSRSCPSTFEHKHLMIQAELSKENGNCLKTMDLYEEAMSRAVAEGFRQDGALICERCGEYLYQFSEKRALTFLKEASRLYGEWGSQYKVNLLSKKFPALLLQQSRLTRLSVLPELSAAPSSASLIGKSWPVGDEEPMIISQSSSPLRWILSNLFRDEVETFEDSTKDEDQPVEKDGAKMRYDSTGFNRKEGGDLDFKLALQSCVEISEAIDLKSIAAKLLEGIMRMMSADYCVMISLDEDGELFIEAIGKKNTVKVVPHEPTLFRPDIAPSNLLHHVISTGSTIRRSPDPQRFDSLFGRDQFYRGSVMRDILGTPIRSQTEVVGALYVEKHSERDQFSVANVEMGVLLSTQAAVSIEKARLYEKMDLAKRAAEEATAERASFLANMSHEIRTPFNALLSCSIFLLDTELSDMQREYVETIRSSAMLTLNIIDAILAFSKIEHGSITLDKTPFSLRECVETSIQLVAEPAATKDLELVHLNRCGEIDTIYGDVTRVRQIIINLVGNAVKFTSNGHIIVETNVEQVSHDNRYEFIISVSDTGIGIPKGARNKVFRAFSQVDGSSRRVYGGSGLGLAISKKLAELMGGSLTFESTEGNGTTFWFNLVATAQKPPETDVRLFQGKRCLIADLHQTAKESLITEIRRLGFEVDHCSTVTEGLDIVKRSSPNYYSLVFVDFKLLHRDRFVECSLIKQHSPSTQLIYMTVFGVPVPGDTKEKGISAILMRPVQRSRLMDIIKKVLNLSWNIDSQLKKAKTANDQGIMRSLADRYPLKILLAEDNVINTRVALQHLKRLGYAADHAKDGVEVLENMQREIKERRSMYDVILMDIQMPNKDGIATAQEILATYESAKQPSIIALTANAAGEDRQKCLSSGMVNFIAKPILPADLAAVLMGIKPLAKSKNDEVYD